MADTLVYAAEAVGADTGLLAAAHDDLRLLGVVSRETAGAAAGFRVINGATGNLVSNGTMSAQGIWVAGNEWAFGGTVATKTAGTAQTLSQTIAPALGQLVSGVSYSLSFVLTRSAGSIAADVGGGTAGTSRSSSSTFTETLVAGSTQVLTFTPSTDFAGTVDTVTLSYVSGGNLVVVPVTLVANGHSEAWFGEHGIPMRNGIGVDWIAGAFDISLITKRVN